MGTSVASAIRPALHGRVFSAAGFAQSLEDAGEVAPPRASTRWSRIVGDRAGELGGSRIRAPTPWRGWSRTPSWGMGSAGRAGRRTIALCRRGDVAGVSRPRMGHGRRKGGGDDGSTPTLRTRRQRLIGPFFVYGHGQARQRTDEEFDLRSVADYFSMLNREANGVSFNKAQRDRALQHGLFPRSWTVELLTFRYCQR